MVGVVVVIHHSAGLDRRSRPRTALEDVRGILSTHPPGTFNCRSADRTRKRVSGLRVSQSTHRAGVRKPDISAARHRLGRGLGETDAQVVAPLQKCCPEKAVPRVLSLVKGQKFCLRARGTTMNALRCTAKTNNGVVRPQRGRWNVSTLGRPMLSMSEVAVLLGTHRATVCRSIERGDFPLAVIRINGRMRVARVAVERLLGGESQRDGGEPHSEADVCSSWVGRSSASSRSMPMYSAARRSSAPTTPV